MSGIESHSSFDLPFDTANEGIDLLLGNSIGVCRLKNKLNNGVEDALLDPSVGQHLTSVLRQKRLRKVLYICLLTTY
jgi:hypothetical protein